MSWHKFNVGDRIKITEHAHARGRSSTRVLYATIEKLSDTTYGVRLDDGRIARLSDPERMNRKAGGLLVEIEAA